MFFLQFFIYTYIFSAIKLREKFDETTKATKKKFAFISIRIQKS